MKSVRELYEEHREAALYIIFGGLTTLVTWLTYALFVSLSIELNISNISSWICGVLFAFVVNKWFVFQSKSTKGKTIFWELGSFFGARILTGVIAIVLFPILIGIGMDGDLFGVDGFPAKIVTSVIEIGMNWIFSKYMIFRKK